MAKGQLRPAGRGRCLSPFPPVGERRERGPPVAGEQLEEVEPRDGGRMTPAFDRLSNILSLEREQDFKNQVVMGGLDKMAASWRKEASQEVHSPERLKLIDEIAGLMVQYSEADGAETRAGLATQMKEMIDSAAAEPPPERPSRPAPPPAAEVVVPSRPSRDRSPRRQESLAGLKAPVTAMPGISSGYAKKLERIGIEVVEDLLYLYPRRYDDFSQLRTINQLSPGEEITIIGTIWSVKERKTARGLTLISAIITDTTGYDRGDLVQPAVPLAALASQSPNRPERQGGSVPRSPRHAVAGVGADREGPHPYRPPGAGVSADGGHWSAVDASPDASHGRILGPAAAGLPAATHPREGRAGPVGPGPDPDPLPRQQRVGREGEASPGVRRVLPHSAGRITPAAPVAQRARPSASGRPGSAR